MSVTPSQFQLLSRLLDAAALRHRVIAQNVANVNTPGYRALEVDFEDALARQLERGGDLAAMTPPRIVEATDARPRADGNTVDIDAQMGQLNKNSLLYGLYSQVMATKMAMMRRAISGP